jgi:hypothetical protein
LQCGSKQKSTKFFFKLGEAATEIHKMFVTVNGSEIVSGMTLNSLKQGCTNSPEVGAA